MPKSAAKGDTVKTVTNDFLNTGIVYAMPVLYYMGY